MTTMQFLVFFSSSDQLLAGLLPVIETRFEFGLEFPETFPTTDWGAWKEPMQGRSEVKKNIVAMSL
jgi:hypothetical protein